MEYAQFVAFAIYFGLLFAVASLTYRKSTNASDFTLGSRSLNFYVTALSAHAADMSAWLFMAYPATVLISGGCATWTAIGLLVGMWANWHFIAPRLRLETERTGSLTLSHYLGARFPDHQRILRLVGAASSLVFMTVYVAAGLVGVGCLMESVFEVHRIWGMTAGLSVVMIYAFIGGYISVAWVDLFQALFLLIALVLVPTVALTKVGGLQTVTEASHSWNVSLSLLPQDGVMGVVIALLVSLGWGLGYFGQPHILSKFMGIGDPSALRKSKWVGLTWQFLSLAAATAVGLIGLAFFSQIPDNPELVFVDMVTALFHPIFASFILCAILAAAISTMDSQLLVLAPILSEDLYHRYFHPTASPKATLWSSRLALILLGLISYAIALFSSQTVMKLAFYSWSGLGSTFGPVLFLALYSQRINGYGAVAGMMFGMVVAAVWPLIETQCPFAIPALIPGFLLNIVVIQAVSALARRMQKVACS